MRLTVKEYDTRHQDSFCLPESVDRYLELTKEAIRSQKPSQARKEAIRLVTAVNLLLEHRSSCIRVIKRHSCHRCKESFASIARHFCKNNYYQWKILHEINIWLIRQGFRIKALDEQVL